jgi:hypothetical protein
VTTSYKEGEESMNRSVGYIFVEKKAPHNTRVEYERADIEDMMDDPNYFFVGRCEYDTENNIIVGV